MKFKSLLLLLVFNIVCGWATVVLAETDSEIHYSHEDLTLLTENEKNEVVREIPQGTVLHGLIKYRLIYEKNADNFETSENQTEISISENDINTNYSMDNDLLISSNVELPKTNERFDLLSFFCLLMIIGMFILLLKLKKIWQILTLLLLVTSIIGLGMKTGAAQQGYLADGIIQQASKGDIYQHVPQSIASYQYVGYVVTKEKELLDVAEIHVYYVDQHGIDLINPLILSGAVDETYQTEAKLFEGYELTGIEGQSTGKFTKETREITYHYTSESPPAATFYKE